MKEKDVTKALKAHMANTCYQQLKLLKNSLPAGVVFLLNVFAGGCALTTDYVTLTYHPQMNVTRIEGADAIKVNVEVLDVRKTRGRVSSKKNSYGMEMAAIIAENNVADTIAKAIEMELINRGFVLATGSVRLLVELQKFYNDFKAGFWSGTATAEVIMNIQVKNSDGNILFSKLVAGEGNLPGIHLASGENAKIALDEALKDAVSNLFNDRAFIDSLFKASRAQPENQ